MVEQAGEFIRQFLQLVFFDKRLNGDSDDVGDFFNDFFNEKSIEGLIDLLSPKALFSIQNAIRPMYDI